MDRLTGKAYSAQTCQGTRLPPGTAVASYFYDQASYQNLAIANGIGRLTGISDQAGTGAYSFDPMGRIKTEQRSVAGITTSMSYEYNLDGSLYKLHYPSGALVTYTPDLAGRTISAVDSVNNINYATGATYQADGQMTGFTSGQSATFAGIANSFTYNNRLQPITMSAVSPSQTVFSIGYDFHWHNSDNGNVFAITNNRDANRSQTFSYDALNRLTSAQNAGTNCTRTVIGGDLAYWGNTYAYDAWGNLTNKTKISTACAGEGLGITVLANNRIADAGYGYDAAGNMTTDGTEGVTLTYDPENRITGASGYTYTYDADGNRVEKSNGSTGTLYWYMTPGIVAESDLTGALKSEYVFFNGDRVARRDFGPTGPTGVSYYFSDLLNTASVITDSAGNIKSDSDYYPWGGELQFVANDPNHYKFTGKERDTETGLDYFGARYYSNGLGRFITPDWAAKATAVPYAEFADPQSLNLYTYVRNIPTSNFDIDGHDDDDGVLMKWFKTLVQPLMDSRKDSSQAPNDNSRFDPLTNTTTQQFVANTTDKVGTAVDKMAAVLTAFDPTGQSGALRSYLNGDKLGLGLAMAGPFVGLAGSELSGAAKAFGFRSFASAGNVVGGELKGGGSALVSFGRNGSELGVGISAVHGPAGTLGKLEQGAINAAESQGASSLKLTAINASKSMGRLLRRKGFTQVMKDGKATSNWTKIIKIKGAQ